MPLKGLINRGGKHENEVFMFFFFDRNSLITTLSMEKAFNKGKYPGRIFFKNVLLEGLTDILSHSLLMTQFNLRCESSGNLNCFMMTLRIP